MAQRANLTVYTKDPKNPSRSLAIACGHWRWGGNTNSAVFQLREFADAFKEEYDKDHENLSDVIVLCNLVARTLQAMGGSWHGKEGEAPLTEPIYWLGEGDMETAPNDVVTEVEVDVSDPLNLRFHVGGSFLQPKLQEEMDDSGMGIEEMVDEDKLIFVYDAQKLAVLRKALDGDPLDLDGLSLFFSLIGEHPYEGGGVYAMPGATEDSDVLVIIGD